MKKTKYRRLAAMAASLLCCLIFTVPAYAQSSEPQPETAPAPAETEAEPETQNPFTPDGTGTVVDNATDEDGKEFYTITTADESVFYLVIDKQKTSENVYFLNTVTTDDLLPLAEQGKEPPKEVTPEPEPTEPVEEVPESKPEKKDSPLLSLLLIGAVVLAGGGIGYYFKIYKPKHEAPDLEDDYCEYEDGELEEIAEEPEDEDLSLIHICPTWWNRERGLRNTRTKWEKKDPENGRYMWDLSLIHILSQTSVICWKNTAKSRDGRLWQSIRTMASQVLTWSVLIYRGC